MLVLKVRSKKFFISYAGNSLQPSFLDNNKYQNKWFNLPTKKLTSKYNNCQYSDYEHYLHGLHPEGIQLRLLHHTQCVEAFQPFCLKK